MRLRGAPVQTWEHPVHRLAMLLTLLRVPYAAIGGVAMAAYVPERRPVDLDVVIAEGPAASVRAARAIHLTLDLLGVIDPHQVQPSARQIESGLEGAIRTRFGDLHVIGGSLPQGCNRTAIIEGRQWAVFGLTPIAIASPFDLLAIKTKTQRDQDELDARSLRGRIARGC